MTFAMPWPRADHTLDGRDTDWRSAAYFDADWGTGYLRIEGFRRSAELHYEQMMTSPCDRNILVYPFASNWRHAIELQLKDLLQLLGRLHKATFDDNLKHTHNLARLWARARQLIESTSATEARAADLTTVTKLIGQLTALDPDGQELRYHERTNGTPSPQGHPHIDVPKFHESLQGIAAFLDGTAEGVHQALEFEREMAWEYGP
ncbi:hypothetical protein PJI20_10315 [Mycobacterium kansasii]